jgi:hypothetical protein
MVSQVCERQAAISTKLALATRAHRYLVLCTVFGWIGLVSGAGGVALISLVRWLWLPENALLMLLSAVPVFAMLVGVLSFVAGRSLRSARGRALDQAYGEALAHLLPMADAGAGSAELAGALRLDQPTTERLLVQVSTRDDVVSDVTDEGQILYRRRSLDGSDAATDHSTAAALRLRVGADRGAFAGSNASDEADVPAETGESARRIKQ